MYICKKIVKYLVNFLTISAACYYNVCVCCSLSTKVILVKNVYYIFIINFIHIYLQLDTFTTYIKECKFLARNSCSNGNSPDHQQNDVNTFHIQFQQICHCQFRECNRNDSIQCNHCDTQGTRGQQSNYLHTILKLYINLKTTQQTIHFSFICYLFWVII